MTVQRHRQPWHRGITIHGLPPITVEAMYVLGADGRTHWYRSITARGLLVITEKSLTLKFSAWPLLESE